MVQTNTDLFYCLEARFIKKKIPVVSMSFIIMDEIKST